MDWPGAQKAVAEQAEEEHEEEPEEEPEDEDEDEGLVAKQAQLAHMYEEEEEEEEEEQGPSFEELVAWYEEACAERERLLLQNSLLQNKIFEHMSRRKQVEDKKELDSKALGELDQRYSRTLAAIDEQHVELARNQALYDRVASDLKDRVDERNTRALDLRREVKNYKRGVFGATEFSRTGKPLPPKAISSFEERDDEREAELSQVRLKHIGLRNQLKKLEATIKAKEELADGLHLIDFEQLKIENQTFNEKIEERNEELLRLRKKTTQTVQVLSHAKEKLQFVMGENQDLKLELAELEAEVNAQRNKLNQVKKERDMLRAKNLEIRQDSGKVATEELAKDYELGKLELEGMRQVFADLKSRHTEISERIRALEVPSRPPSKPRPGGGTAPQRMPMFKM
jgi:hypothetical protein